MFFFFLACNEVSSKKEALPEIKILSTEELGFAVEEASWALLSVDPQLHHDGWKEAMENYSDESCPPMEEHNGMDLWRESCTTEAGHQFLGWTLRFVLEDKNFFEETHFLTDYYWLSGQAQIISQTGSRIQNFGDILHQKGQTIDYLPWFEGFVYGDFAWNGTEAENSWLQSNLTMEYYYTFSGIQNKLNIDIQAWISGFSIETPAGIFEEIIFDTAICPDEPLSGSIWIRDQNGLWTEIIYDGLDVCDGCGFQIETTEKICSDFSMWSSWDTEPWESR